MRIISNSEVTTWNTCHAKYRYTHDLKLEPVKFSASLSLGILLHNALEHYYRIMLKSGNQAEALHAARSVVQQSVMKDADTAMKAYKILDLYFQYYADEFKRWEIKAVEAEYDIALTADYTYRCKLDLLVLDRADNSYKLVDHKSTYDFWKEEDFTLNAQFPKYVGAVRHNGIPVTEVVVNQLRTRSLKNPALDDLYRRTSITYSDVTIRNALQEQIVASEQITAFRSLPEPLRKQQATRIMNKQVCRMCGVRSLCEGEYNGSSIDYLIQTDYKPNTYDEGYNPTKFEGGEW